MAAIAFGAEKLTEWDADHSEPDSGANIGLGLLLIAAFVIIGGLAGALDGRSSVSAVQLVARWVLISLTTGIGDAVYRSITYGQLTLGDVAANYVLSTALIGFTLGVPAIVGAVVVRHAVWSNSGRRRAPSSGNHSEWGV